MQEFIPALVVFGATAVIAVAAVFGVRMYRRGSRATSRREVVWTRAGSALVHLDTAIEESDIELGLAGALYGETAPRTLAAARAHAVQVRDSAFVKYQAALENKAKDPGAARLAKSAGDLATQGLNRLELAQMEHQKWLNTNADAPAQVIVAREKLTSLIQGAGDPDALEKDLVGRFAESETKPVREALELFRSAVSVAEESISRAEEAALTPGASVIADLSDGERALRAAETASAAAEQAHKAIIDASIAVSGELAAVRRDITQGAALQAQVPADAAVKMSEEREKALAAVEEVEPRAAQEPTAVIAAISRIRDRIDVALSSARSARDRIEGARSALPGTIATARSAIAHAEAVLSQGGGIDARVRLTAANDALAASRTADDAVAALDAVRRAIRHAEDAEALALYSRKNP